MKEAEKTVICICTYRRPRELKRLLESLDKQRFSKIDEPEISVVVVENDAVAGARAICEKFERLLRWPLRYEIEAKPGISHARNRCLSMVSEETDFVAFVDDDETVTTNWLKSLLSVQRRYSADIVAGPVLPSYDISAPEWIRQGEFHNHQRYRTGALISECGAGNVLIASSFVKKHGLEFDPDFGLSGGEDVLFFTTAERIGAKMVWCDEAIAYEIIPRERATATWLLQRSFRIGTTNAKTMRRLDGKVKGLAASLWCGTTRLLVGGLVAPFGLLAGRAPMFRALCRAAYGLGSLVGSFGYTYQIYRRRM